MVLRLIQEREEYKISLKKVNLTIADRQIIGNLIADPPKADLDTARQVAEVRRRLGIRQASKLVDKLNEGLRDLTMLPLSWDDLDDPTDRLADIDDKIEVEEVDKERDELEKFRKQLEKIAEVEYTIDDAYLKWLRSLCVEKDWKKAKRQERDGSVREVEVIAHPSLLVAFADLADKIEAAIAAKE